MNYDVVAIHGFIWLLAGLGILGFLKWREMTAEREAKAERFWRDAMQPYLQTRGHDFSDDDMLHDYPLLPEEYEDWKR